MEEVRITECAEKVVEAASHDLAGPGYREAVRQAMHLCKIDIESECCHLKSGLSL